MRQALYGHPLAGDWFSVMAAKDAQEYGFKLLHEDVSEAFWVLRDKTEIVPCRRTQVCGSSSHLRWSSLRSIVRNWSVK